MNLCKLTRASCALSHLVLQDLQTANVILQRRVSVGAFFAQQFYLEEQLFLLFGSFPQLICKPRILSCEFRDQGRLLFFRPPRPLALLLELGSQILKVRLHLHGTRFIFASSLLEFSPQQVSFLLEHLNKNENIFEFF